MIIKILGTGCKKCLMLEEKVKNIITENNIEAEIIKVQEIEDIMKYSILSTPGLVVNEKVVSFGKIPSEDDILTWLK